MLVLRRWRPRRDFSFAEFETLHARLLEIDWVTRGAPSIVCENDRQKRGVSPSTDQAYGCREFCSSRTGKSRKIWDGSLGTSRLAILKLPYVRQHAFSTGPLISFCAAGWNGRCRFMTSPPSHHGIAPLGLLPQNCPSGHCFLRLIPVLIGHQFAPWLASSLGVPN
jgi:hypothetical protein